MAALPIEPKRSRRSRSRIAPPVHYIDLTTDSPIPARQSRGRPSYLDFYDCELDAENAHDIRLLDTILIDSTEPSPDREHRVRRRRRSPTPPAAPAAIPEADLIIDLDTTAANPPDHLIPQINDSVDGSPTVLTCPVCLEDLRPSRKPMSTKCGHIFCEECLITTLSTKKKCPKCNGSITRKSCHRIYF